MTETRNTTRLPLTENRTTGEADKPQSISEFKSAAEHETRSTSAEAQRAASGLKQSSRESAAHVQRQVSQAADEVTRKASDAAERARTEAISYFDRQKTCTAETIEHVGEALDRAAEKLHEENDENLAHYTEAIASDTHRVASYLREKDPQACVRDARSFVRRHPVTAFAGLFAAGLAISRFLKASEESAAEYTGPHGRDDDETPGDPQTRSPSPATARF